MYSNKLIPYKTITNKLSRTRRQREGRAPRPSLPRGLYVRLVLRKATLSSNIKTCSQLAETTNQLCLEKPTRAAMRP
jgi:hypothetical protein